MITVVCAYAMEGQRKSVDPKLYHSIEWLGGYRRGVIDGAHDSTSYWINVYMLIPWPEEATDGKSEYMFVKVVTYILHSYLNNGFAPTHPKLSCVR